MVLDATALQELEALGIDPEAVDLAELEQELEAEQAADAAWLHAVQRTFPLVCSMLWRAPEAVCDQQRAALVVLNTVQIALIKGGNRSGKSRLMIELTIVLALGRAHPVTQHWCALNDIPLELIPVGPGECWASALRHDDSIAYHRPIFRELLGGLPCRWYSEESQGEARCYIKVPGYRKRALIRFKAVQSGPDAYQGASVRLAWFDEEPDELKGPGVIRESMMRVADQKGRVVVTYAALKGLTWMHQRYEVERRDHVDIVRLDALDNPYLPLEHFREIVYDGMTEDEIAQRRYGDARPKQGLVYPMYEPGDGTRAGRGHMVDDFEVPAEWVRFRMGDFGLVNPTCILWGALGDDDTLYVYREYYVPNGDSYEWHADAVAELEGLDRTEEGWVRGDRSEPIEAGCGDPAAKEAREAFAAANLPMAPADNDVKGGIDRVRNRLRVRGDGRPRLKIFRSCTNLLREMGIYRWDPNRKDEMPLKKDDHAPDALRYGVALVDDWSGVLCW
jgi:phage terminase large subunit-like protein